MKFSEIRWGRKEVLSQLWVLEANSDFQAERAAEIMALGEITRQIRGREEASPVRGAGSLDMLEDLTLNFHRHKATSQARRGLPNSSRSLATQ